MNRTTVAILAVLICAGCSQAGSRDSESSTALPATTTPTSTNAPREGSRAGDKLEGLPLSSAGLFELPHELGHAMFGFPDEYVGRRFGFDGRLDLSSWPSCAESLEEARAWWGDLEGDVDPMVEIWVDEMASIGHDIGTVEALEPLIEVGYVDNGCYGVPGSIRATEDSLMNGSIPVMGSVNRRWAERVLALWDGADRP